MTPEQNYGREKVVDIRPVFLHELEELPQEILGEICETLFTDAYGMSMTKGYVIVNPEFVDSNGRKRKMDSDFNSKPFIPKRLDESFIGQRWVDLSQLVEKLEALGKGKSVKLGLTYTTESDETPNDWEP